MLSNDPLATRPLQQPIPALLLPAVEQRMAALLPLLEPLLAADELTPMFTEQLRQVSACSPFVAQEILRQPAMFVELWQQGLLSRAYLADEMARVVRAMLAEVVDEATLLQQLRKIRRREMVRIAWRDLVAGAPLSEVVADLSQLASLLLDFSLNYLYTLHCEQWGTPYSSAAEGDQQQHLVVLGMGKLGAGELNYSSDIDLIFAYPEEGETRGGRRQLTNQEFFIRLGQRLIRALDSTTAEGRVFRVDMRLRPFGEVSPLAISFDAMEGYYQTHGREWERYALIKAQVVAGDRQQGALLLKRIRPFIYRRYVDFGAFESLREMKEMIAREVERKGLHHNVKLGAGGIREIEFIGQAFQLIRGGRDKALQIQPILSVLEVLRGMRLLPDAVVDALHRAYLLLRRSEHRLQQVEDQQTHLLPLASDALGRARHAFAMGFADWPAFAAVVEAEMAMVHQHFMQIFALPAAASQGEAAPQRDALTQLWSTLSLHAAEGESVVSEVIDHQDNPAALQAAGYGDVDELLRRLLILLRGHAVIHMSAIARRRLDQLMPALLREAGQVEQSDATLLRLLAIIEAVARRSAYLALLIENPQALSQLVRLTAASPWIARQIVRHPQLLDELLDPRTLYAVPQREALQNELHARLLAVDVGDEEQELELLRRFQQAVLLRIAAADITETVPLMRVSDHLTDLAEMIVDAALRQAWRVLQGRFGVPQMPGRPPLVTEPFGFAVIGYGKMGGIELGYGSDLDLVFICADAMGAYRSNGARQIDGETFMARLGQRLLSRLNIRTPSGTLYEIDTRLRPSGASGLLVSTLSAFEEYQTKHAWTWEHQALVRARVVCGDAAVANTFSLIRREILCQPREIGKLREEVVMMRDKMRQQLDKSSSEQFDLKQGEGGIADIEFMVQFAVLAWSSASPAICYYSDNIRILEALAAAGKITLAESEDLIDAYKTLRAQVHRLNLLELPALVAANDYLAQRQRVTALWQQFFVV
ncbi:MAG: bifunctional [glutamate--ammonia ligase]-adenylyl-L-tyrosine phosphorylase/[glutamate--ammonia-ligase] adenylyltransferase [Gammaproteobacteria bacterium]|nr:bifunctional [glutamate--ammonia ligase]-adenylyl-L-tyrosine phosphorylase/[glutamate--ammonia-ligase] adenylyltransferase [Gammaproteobacteria bacterium]